MAQLRDFFLGLHFLLHFNLCYFNFFKMFKLLHKGGREINRAIFKSKKTILPKTIQNFTLKFMLGNDKLITNNYHDRSILATHTICTSHIVFMCLSGSPKQILHKTVSFRQEQNRSLWRKMHCRSHTLLGVKEWPQRLFQQSLFLSLSQTTSFD